MPSWLLLLVALTLAGNLGAWLGIGLLPDEAYYWVWSQRPELGYYDHPPLVAWMIRPVTELFGNVDWAIRLPAVAGWFIGAGFAYRLASELFQRRSAGHLALAIWCSLPIMQVGFHIVTPDTPMVLLTWISYYLAYRAIRYDRPFYWLAAGLAIGLTVLAKYPGALVALALFVPLLLSRAGRRYLATPLPWLGVVVALAAFSPVLLWNYQHEWISFSFQFHHGVQVSDEQSAGAFFMQFLAGQMAAVMPWTLIVMAVSGFIVKRHIDMATPVFYHQLLAGFWLPLLVFGLAGLSAKSHPNWPVAAYVPGTILLAGVLDAWLLRTAPSAKRYIPLIAAFLLSLVLVNLLRFPHWLQLLDSRIPAQRTQLSQAYGWQQVGKVLHERLQRIESEKNMPGRCIVLGNKLQTASMLALKLGDALRASTPDTTRFNQYHIWRQEQPLPTERLCLYVEQFEKGDWIAKRRDLGKLGLWRLDSTLVPSTPDNSGRVTAFYLPAERR